LCCTGWGTVLILLDVSLSILSVMLYIVGTYFPTTVSVKHIWHDAAILRLQICGPCFSDAQSLGDRLYFVVLFGLSTLLWHLEGRSGTA
jgi:hypothetical protein